MLVTGTLTLNASYSAQSSNDIIFIVDGGLITWTASADFNVGTNSVFYLINGGSVSNGSGPCNAAKRISFGGSTIASCNGGGGASVASFTQINAAGGVNNSGPLPVDLINFDVTQTNRFNYLSWTTASEYNNSHFEIEKSTDGINFFKIASIKGAGSSNIITNYSYLGSGALNSYYRLKQIDFNGSFAYSKIIKSFGQENFPQLEVSVFPNPFQDRLTIEANMQDINFIEVKLFNKQGKRVQVLHSTEHQDGKAIIRLNVSFLPADIYFVHTLVNNKAFVSKVAKL